MMKNPDKMSENELRNEVISSRKELVRRFKKGAKLVVDNYRLKRKLDGIDFAYSAITTDQKDLQFRLDRVTNKLFEYVAEIQQLQADKNELTEKCADQRQMLFESAGHIAAVKEPTIHGLHFSTDIYESITRDIYRTGHWKRLEFIKLRKREAEAALAETIEARQGR